MEHLIGLDFKNFQSLEDTQLNLAPGLNVIVGASNLGKSAAIRGLKAMVYNTPVTGLIREGAKEFELKAWFADGESVGLSKGKNKSEFYLNDDTYAKAGANDVPDSIKKQWSIATPEGRQLCFASQHESPFLLAEPASAVAKVLGDLTNASMLMEAVQRANKLRAAATADAKARTREAEEAREEILTHAGLTARGKALQTAREAYRDAVAVVQEVSELRTIVETRERLLVERAELTKLTESNVSFDNFIAEAEENLRVVRELEQLQDEYQGLKSQQWQVRTGMELLLQKIASKEKEIKTLLEKAGVCPVCQQSTH